MSRTPEQRDADEALTAAIARVWEAYAPDDDGEQGMLGDYIVIGARFGFDEHGDRWTQVGSFTRDNNVPMYIQLGLLAERDNWLRQPDEDD
ncbi:hypothetical protein [Nocardia wallacei]|uniref:hypothetical protein n=1 Tax=Nocardia wallacei TaxID=480035 RepID=UPI002455B311|nr:hypothetical protein [Nocardia wallacei]